ncbi:ABC transporter ATP-binding protein [Deinococcus ficus]|uniref:ABC transporter ATP-binding protein n=1 Tax=Deinococcus ficus TaxID=317577 RepID=A0A221ST66_9DEIO|nr:ABC transporter ATP-binding protein [Deinococcus ficus]ASN79826.1 ABC transporter ATP-binding protein [Deinococcus ficus]
MPAQTQAKELTGWELLRVLRRALPDLLRSAPLLVGGMFLAGLVQGLLPAVTVLIGKWTVDGVTRLAAGGQADLTALAAAWAGAALLGQVAFAARGMLQGSVADHFTVQTVARLMGKMEALPGLDVLEDPRFHDDVEILQTGASHRPLNLTAVVLALLNDGVAILALAATLLTVGWWVPLVAVAGLLPLARRQMDLYRLGWSLTLQKTQEARELNYHQRVAIRHEYAKEVRLYGLLPHLRDAYVGRARAYQRTMRGVRNAQLGGVLPYQALSLLVTAGIFAYAVQAAGTGTLTAGGVVLVITALGQMRDRLEALSNIVSSGTEHLRWFGRYHAFLDAAPRVARPETPRPLPARLDLTLEGVSFGYRDGPAVLEDVTVHIPEGQVVAVVGENGAGKSTLVNLLLRFYDPRSGRVLVGAGEARTDLRDLDPAAWRAQVAAVFQDFARFEWTLRENVTLGRAGLPADLHRAVHGSGLNAVLERVEGGLDARIGAAFGGIDLSGGQWQKLATARALYRDARLLILDEPTAALDPRSEAEVFQAFAALAQGRTTLLITHRLGSVLMADRILVMKRGRLIEDGTHASLLAAGGEYAELWQLQARQYAGQEGRGDVTPTGPAVLT